MPAWLTKTTPGGIRRYLENQAGTRKQAQFMRALCGVFVEVFSDPRSTAALDAADGFEAGVFDEAAYLAACQAGDDARQEALAARERSLADPAGRADHAARGMSMSVSIATSLAYHLATLGYYPGSITHLRDAIDFRAYSAGDTTRRKLPEPMRATFWELFGNPFRPVTCDPAWRTEAVVALAAGIYAERAFERMPVLADSLDDAGCANADVLAHCRGGGPHARGCWVVDLILGKA